ncbi:Uncharacterised protein [uncultured archaeon]|nr:Uncharacterised protein [uncultured archaeon]
MWNEPSRGKIRIKKARIYLNHEQPWIDDLEETERISSAVNNAIGRLSQMSITEMDGSGRVLLPIGIRYRLDLNEGDKLAVDQLGDGTIILMKVARRLRSKLSP